MQIILVDHKLLVSSDQISGFYVQKLYWDFELIIVHTCYVIPVCEYKGYEKYFTNWKNELYSTVH